MKKSWNPKLLKNREKVWKKEQEILNEHKKAQLHSAKLKELDEKNELLSLVEGQSTEPKNRANKTTNWMYQSTGGSHSGFTEQVNDDVLLGKRKLNDAIPDGKTAKKMTRMDRVLKSGLEKKDEAAEGSTNEKEKEEEQISKTDPLYAIKLQQMKQREYMEKQKKLKKYRQRERERTHTPRDRAGDDRARSSRHTSHTHRHDRSAGHHRDAGYGYERGDEGRYRSAPRDTHRTRDHDPRRREENYRERR